MRHPDAEGGGRRFDLELARLVQRLERDTDPGNGSVSRAHASAEGGTDEVAMAAYLVSRQAAEGDVCIDLAAYARRSLVPGSPGAVPMIAPDLECWMRSLAASPLVGGAGDYAPLILDAGRLYLGRYWHYEANVARSLGARARQVRELPQARLLPLLERLFPGAAGTDWQRIATLVALHHGIGVISGGPGTGKTTTVAKMLALAITLAPTPPRIGLAAPTGKAAARLTESIDRIRATLDFDPDLRLRIPASAQTIHRLLGYRPSTFSFRHDRKNPLHLDLLVLDEASMIDLPLMSKLMDALPEHCGLILVGDKDQLASVEAGSVLGDICRDSSTTPYSPQLDAFLRLCHPEPLALAAVETAADPRPVSRDVRSQAPIADCIGLLRKSYRFDDSSPLGQLARAVNQGDDDGVLRLLREADDSQVRWIEDPRALHEYLQTTALPRFAQALAVCEPEQALADLEGYRLLSAVREGWLGVPALDAAIERLLAARGLIPPQVIWYPGRPVLITRNDHALGLYNGDTGVALADPRSAGRLRVFFRGTQGELRCLLPQRLPTHETAYAMTVHKSQGSEFDHIGLILPDAGSPLLTRELLYTAITRSRSRVDIIAGERSLTEAIRTPTVRVSGLAPALWGS